MADFNVDDVLGVLGTGGDVSRETEGMPQKTKPRTPLSVDDVSGVLSDMDKERTRQSVFKGVHEDPDAFAKDRATADRAGVPVDAVRMDRQNVESSLKVDDVMGVLEKAPVTKAFMNDENNAKIAHDDVESLSTFENLAAGIGEGFFNRVAGGMTRTVGTFADEIGDALERNIPLGVIEYDFSGEGPLLDWRASTEADLAKEDLTGLLESARVFESVSLGYKPMTTWQNVKDAPLAQFLPFALEQGIVSLPDMIAVMGNLPAYVAAQTGYIGQERAANEGRVAATAGDLVKAAPFAIGSAMLERLGTKGILGIDDAVKQLGIKGVAKATAKGAAKEGVTEFGQEGLEYAGATLGTERGFDIADGLDQALAGMVGGFGFGGTIRAGTASVESFVKSKQAKSRGESLRSSNDAAMQSKLNQRDPARAAAHRAAVLRKQGIETVSIDAESVNTFFQGYMADDSGFIEKLGITEQEMSEAVAIGGDIEISVDAFAEHLYGTDRFNDIADYVRLGADNMTVAEATQYEETGLKEQIANLDSEIEGMDTVARTEADTIRSEVEQMMTEAGQVGDSARFAGSLVAAEYATTAQRAGVSALDLWKQDRISILGPDGTARPTVDDLTILLDKARTEDAETFLGLSKTPAIDMLAEKGGVDPGGSLASELAVLGVTSKTNPGLFRKGGLQTADNLVQSELDLFADLQLDEDQRGYIPVDEIVAAVQEELAGAPRRTVDETAALEAFGADVGNLVAMMDEAGITLDATEADIRAAIEALEAPATTATQNEDVAKILANKDDLIKDVLTQERKFAKAIAGTDPESDAYEAAVLKNTEAHAGIAEKYGLEYGDNTAFVDLSADISLSFDKNLRPKRQAELARAKMDKWEARTALDTMTFEQAAKDGPQGQQIQRAFVFNEDGTMTLKMTKKEVEFLAIDANEFVDAAPSLKIEDNVLTVNQDELDSLGDFILDIKAADGPGAVPPRIRKFFQRADTGPRGSITFDTKETIIRMFDAADKSTFLHESGHLFLDHVKRNAAQFGETTPQFKEDWDTVKKWWGKNAEILRAEAIKTARAQGDTATITALGKMSEKAVIDYVRSGNLTGEAELYQGATGDVADGSPEVYLTRAMHEQWARGVEDYFRTGQAPSVALQDAFNRFRAWLVSVYSAATRRGALDVQLPTDVKQVLDRLLATDEEISLVEEQYNLKAFFPSAEEAGMTKSKWATYQHVIARESEDAKTRQLKKHLNDIERVQRQWWKDESTRIRETEVEPDVYARPAYKVMYGLARGTNPDGSEIEGGLRPSRLDRKAVVAILENEESLKRLPKVGATGIIATGKEGGAHPDVIGQMYGYEDGRAMLMDLMNAAPMKDVIAAETESRMKAEYGDMQDNAQAVNEALESVHADKRGEVLAMELNQLRESGDKMKPAFVRQWAKDRIGGYKVDAIRPDKFLAAERKHGKEAGKLLHAGDRLGAQQAKFRQIMNFYMAKEAYKERAKVDKSRRYLDKFNRAKKTFKGLDADYLDKIRLLLGAYELGPRLTPRSETILELKAMNEWINAKEEDDGAILQIPARILAATEKTHFRDLTLDEYRELVDSVKNIEQQGRLKKTALISGEKRLIDDMAGEIADRLDQLPQSKRVSRKAIVQNPELMDRAVGRLASFDASLRKVEFLLEKVDGEKMGPAHRYIFDVFADAEHARNDMSKDVTAKVMEALDGIPKAVRSKLAEKIEVSQLGRTFRRSDLLMMALNSGNESNLSKMIEGSEKDVAAGAQAWTQEGVDAALANLTKEEWDFVQTVWDSFEGMYPEVEAIYKRENGVAPERVEPRKIETAYGDYGGGYFPMMYDPERSAQAREIEGKSAIEAMQSASFKGSVNSSMTKARTGFSAPVLLNIEALPNHIERTAHFITHYEAVRSTRKLLAHPSVVSAMTNKLGQEYFDVIKHWVNELAANGQPSNPTSITGKMVEGMRTNATVAIMGFSYTTMASQVLGYANSVDALAKQSDGSYSPLKASKWLSIGLMKYLSNPLAAKRWVFEASGEMRHRLENTDRDIRHGLKKLAGKKGAWKSMQRASLLGIAGVQVYMVDFPTWIGAYNKGISEGVSDPVRYADSVLRMSQTAGGIKDLSEIQREPGVTKALTMFYSYFNLLYNMEAEAVGEVKAARDIPRIVARAMVLLTIPTAAEAIMRNQWPEDDEDYGAWLARKAALYGLTSIPFLRDLVGLAEGFGYSSTPLDSLGKSLGRSVAGVSRAIDDGDVTTGTIKATVATFGFAAGAPVTAVNRIVGAAAAMMDGEDVGPYDFLVGHKKK